MDSLTSDGGGEAELRYLDADFEVIRLGGFVRCAVTGEPVPLGQLRYWSVDRQEAYRDAAAANEAFEASREKDEGF